jgi:23S rRNA (uracil1939-C5)-methyltransferase
VACEVDFGRYTKKHIHGTARPTYEAPEGYRSPPCALASICGGCSFQHADYERQLQWKRRLFLDETDRLDWIQEKGVSLQIQAGSSELGYRNKMEFTFGEGLEGEKLLGLHEKGGGFSRIVDLPSCPLQSPTMNRIFEVVRHWYQSSEVQAYRKKDHSGALRHLVLRHSLAQDQIQVNLVGTEKPVDLDKLVKHLKETQEVQAVFFTTNEALADAVIFEKIELLWGEPRLVETLGEFSFEIAPQSFFQVNTKAAEKLYGVIQAMIETHVLAKIPEKKLGKCVDLYCGAGSIGIFLSGLFEKLWGVESVPEALEDAKRNARRNGINHAEFICAKVEDLSKDWSELNEPDVLILDPPRSGFHPKALAGISRINAKFMVYVCCNPCSLSDNLQAFIKRSNYQILDLQLIDLFPQTPHLEAVVILKK